MENKRVLTQLIQRWNRPIYEKETSHRVIRTIAEEPEAMEVPAPGSTGASGGGARRGMTQRLPQREEAGRDESVGNILSATSR